jgi:hypothetical protein
LLALGSYKLNIWGKCGHFSVTFTNFASSNCFCQHFQVSPFRLLAFDMWKCYLKIFLKWIHCFSCINFPCLLYIYLYVFTWRIKVLIVCALMAWTRRHERNYSLLYQAGSGVTSLFSSLPVHLQDISQTTGSFSNNSKVGSVVLVCPSSSKLTTTYKLLEVLDVSGKIILKWILEK